MEEDEGGGGTRVRRDQQRVSEDEQHDRQLQQDLQGRDWPRWHLSQRHPGSFLFGFFFAEIDKSVEIRECALL